MGYGTDEIDDRLSGRRSGGLDPVESRDVGSVPAGERRDDTVTDASFNEGLAGAAYADNLTGTPASESLTSAPYARDLADDPYGERSGAGFAQDTDAYGDVDSPPDADDPDIEATRAQIEHTRAEMSETIDAIQQKLSPSNLAEQAKETVHDATIGKAQDIVSNVSDTARDAVSNVSGTARDAVSNVSGTAKEAVSSAGDTARGASSTFVDTIRQNPVPVALTGIGVGWLIMSLRKSGSSTRTTQYSNELPYSYSEDYTSGRAYGIDQSAYSGYEAGGTLDQTQGRAADLASQAQSKAGDLASQAQSRASDIAGQVQGTASGLANQAQSTASGLASQAQNTAGQFSSQARGITGETVSQARDATRRVANSASGTLQQNPLGVAAAALGLGLVAGLVIPETQKEDQLLGQARDSVAQRAQQTVQETAQKVQTVAQEAISAGKQEAQDQNLM